MNDCMISRWVLVAICTFALSACAMVEKQDLTAFNAAPPRSILVVPVVNKTLDVDAANYLLSALSVPAAEKGYYVFPVNTVKYVLEQEGYYEADTVHKQPPEVLAKLFDADSVLYVTINRWDAQYLIFATTVTVDFSYRLVNRQGVDIWVNHQSMVYQPQNSSTGNPLADLMVMAVNAAVTRAAPNYMPLARQANGKAIMTGINALPDGPYVVPKAAVETKL
jgi:hypothetical protein